ncbi:hypothetical protein PHYBOEH_011403 [Phytophthora boehmeriae]|uniref:Mannosylglycerate hydrolase MGH1-like glycoside hydrolase domain-containing protein n=1 Tax=Phytophthora boehmeriae TaxID=109152 RepID=A0A8T1X3I4_9STRA|nr:hypothetical protein PHYBOEH_011403 [Phytophthora boehmeriae]
MLLHSLLCLCALFWTATASSCDEWKLQRDAATLLTARVDVELGGVAAGKREDVGFQYLKPAEALMAAQAIAHEDFTQAAAQVQHILQYQTSDGLLPHLVYGPSVPSHRRWISSNRTFHPGPAFWQHKGGESSSVLNTSTISAPPVAADVVWEIFRLAPYESTMGVRTAAVQFLCSVYQPLKKLQEYLFSTRRGAAPTSLLAAHHPWETFSSLSPHWKGFLAQLKEAPDYHATISSIPEEARERFALGAGSMFSAEDAVENLYEPMIYLAAQHHRRGNHRGAATLNSPIYYSGMKRETIRFGVEDVEFNALMLRSSFGLLNIGRVLVEHSSVCTEFELTEKELLGDVKELRSMARGLEEALVGNNKTRGLWNTSVDFFADSMYFVANRPRESRSPPTSAARRRSSGGKKLGSKVDGRREDLEDRGRSSGGSSWAERYSESSYSDYSPRSGHTPHDLEESLISAEDERYGSFDEAEPQRAPTNSVWRSAKDALAAISPW